MLFAIYCCYIAEGFPHSRQSMPVFFIKEAIETGLHNG